MSALNYAIFGINGFAGAHLKAAEQLADQGILSIEAVAEPFQDRCSEKLDELRENGTRIYDDYRVLLDAEDGMDMISVPTPIPLHRPMTLACLEYGAHVLLEKPPAVLVQDVDEMLRTARKTGQMCQVGFQHMYDQAARSIKNHIAKGRIGDVQEVVLEGYWRRLDGYYARAGWAGKTRLDDDWVLDGPLNNPLCHYIHESLYMVCPEPHRTMQPVSVQAELYHAHPIQGEDTVCARAELENGAVLNTYLTLCAPESQNPHVRIQGSDGVAEWSPGQYRIDGRDGVLEGEKTSGATIMPMRNLAEAIKGNCEQESPLSATRNVILHNNGCYKSSESIRAVPDVIVNRYEVDDGNTATEVDGLMDSLRHAARNRQLLSESGVEWATETPTVALDFSEFHPEKLDLE